MTVNQGVLMECFGAFPEGILAGGGGGDMERQHKERQQMV